MSSTKKMSLYDQNEIQKDSDLEVPYFFAKSLKYFEFHDSHILGIRRDNRGIKSEHPKHPHLPMCRE